MCTRWLLAEPSRNKNENSVFLLEDNDLDTRKELSINAFFSLEIKTTSPKT